jgi:hypothetical protein
MKMIKNLRNVEGFEEYSDYSVSSNGKVISHKRKKDRVLSPSDNGHGYLHVVLSLNGKRKGISVHKLVALAFCKGYEKNLEVNHVDENKKNNNYKNLDWTTHKENINHGTGRKRHDKAISKPVAQLTLGGKLVKIWASATQARDIGGFHNGHISEVCSGRYKTHAGFKWEFTLESEVK